MTATTTKPQTPRLVDRVAARRILDMACQRKVSIGLCRADAAPNTQVAGTLRRIGGDDETLVMALGAPLDPVSPGETFEVSFRIATQGFAFRAAYVGIDNPAEPTGVVFAYPTALEAVDRRCAPRRRFRHRSIVAIEVLSPASSWAVRGSLLNLSASGLAFLLEAPPPQRLAVGVRIRATLEGGATTDPLPLPARIVSVTQGANHRSWVVGIEFLRDELSPEVGDCLDQWLKLPQ